MKVIRGFLVKCIETTIELSASTKVLSKRPLYFKGWFPEKQYVKLYHSKLPHTINSIKTQMMETKKKSEEKIKEVLNNNEG